jgi:8-oxo-dGTP pyrophosphatase MutT (NUDIX family)
MSGDLYSAAEFRRRALRQTGNPAELLWEDHADNLMNPGVSSLLDKISLRDAAVLVPVIDDGPDARVILTQRTSTLRKHSGQVAFPGGAVDPEDASVEAAAMREAAEEIGLSKDYIEPVARLPQYRTMTGFAITPVLAVVRPGFELKINPDEVEATFEVPLSFLMDERNHIRDSRSWEGQERFFYRMPYGDWNIWGVTAGILHTAWERLYAW